MTRRGNLQGPIVAIVTPFRNGRIDYVRLERLIELQLEGGTEGIVPVGTTGESPTLADHEQGELIRFVVERVRGRVPVIAGAGANSTDHAVELVTQAEKVGADATLQITPYYNKPTQAGLVRHFSAVAEATSLPIVLYNVPGRTGTNLLPETAERLADAFEHIVAVKEASGDLDQVSRLLATTDLTVLSGDDSLTLPILALGGSGVISVVANIVPAGLRTLFDAWREGDRERAAREHLRLFPLCRSMFLESNPSPVKAALELMGLASDEVRSPLVPVSDDTRAAIAQELRAYGVELG